MDKAAPVAERSIRVLAIDHTAGVSLFRRKFAAIAAHPDIELTVLAPRRWIENYREVRLPHVPVVEDGYLLRTGSVLWAGYENRGFFTSGLIEAVRAVRPDILHIWEEPFSLFALETLLVRSVLAPRAHALFFSSDNLSRDFRYSYRPSWLYAQIERYAHRACATGTAVSREVVEVLRAKGFRGAIDVVPHGLDLEDYLERGDDGGRPAGPSDAATHERRTRRPHVGLERPVVGYLGRLVPQKGIDTLIRAFAAIQEPEERLGGSLLIVGDGPYRGSLETLAGSFRLGSRVLFLGAVPHEKAATLLRMIDILVLPSRTWPTWKEQFGRVLIEGMAAGCAVIGSRSGAIPEVIGDAGLTFPEGDAAGLQEALGRVIRDHAFAEDLRRRGAERVRREYTWESVAAKIVARYRSLMETPPSRQSA